MSKQAVFVSYLFLTVFHGDLLLQGKKDSGVNLEDLMSCLPENLVFCELVLVNCFMLT